MKNNESNMKNGKIIIEPKSISMNIENKAIKSICKIKIKKKNENDFYYCTGFFMKFSNSLDYPITNHYLTGSDIEYENIELEIWNNKIMNLSYPNRYRNIIQNQLIDITIVEIKNSDSIYKDIEFLIYDSDYLTGYEIYKNVDVFTIQYPNGQDASCAYGKILNINGYEFDHNIPTENDSTGCPIILLNNNINLFQIIGIHNNYSIENDVNKGIFIGEIVNQIKNDSKLGNEENNNIIDNINNNINLGNEENDNIIDIISNNLNFENEENNNIKGNIINNINNNLNLINLNQNDEAEEEYNNYIIAQIVIDEDNVNKEIRIINSYEQCSKKEIVLSNHLDYFNENEIKQCQILINEDSIPFCYFYKFSRTGQYIIRYVFKNLLTKTNFMFCDCKYIVDVDLFSFKSEKVTNMCGMFMNCNSLISINLFNLNTQNVGNMSYMFSGCSSLKGLDLANLDTRNVNNMSFMLDGCSSLLNIYLSKIFNTQNVTDMSYMFSNCSALTNLDLIDFNIENVRNMEYMFNNCSSLLSLNLKHFSVQNNTKLNKIFNGCKSLQKENIIYIDEKICELLNDIKNEKLDENVDGLSN